MIKAISLFILTATVFSGCVVAHGPAGITAPFTVIKAPGQVGPSEFSSVSAKTGKACASGVLGTAHGDASVASAMANGGITKVESIDYEILNFIIYARMCTIVKGR